MRILGIDYGDKRIGLAMSDPLGIIAGALETYVRRGESDIYYICNIIKTNGVQTVVMGLPKNMDGSEGVSSAKARDFGDKLAAASNATIVYKDERLSSVSANRVLDEAGVHWSKRNAVVDTMAAQIILQAYLDASSRISNK